FLLPYLYPALESVADYLPRSTVVWMADSANSEAALEAFLDRLAAYAVDAKAADRFASPPARLFCASHDVVARLAAQCTVALEGLENVNTDLAVSSTLLTDLKLQPHTKTGERSLAPLAARINQWREDGVQVLLVVSNTVQAAHLQNLLLGHELHLPILPE